MWTFCWVSSTTWHAGSQILSRKYLMEKLMRLIKNCVQPSPMQHQHVLYVPWNIGRLRVKGREGGIVHCSELSFFGQVTVRDESTRDWLEAGNSSSKQSTVWWQLQTIKHSYMYMRFTSRNTYTTLNIYSHVRTCTHTYTNVYTHRYMYIQYIHAKTTHTCKNVQYYGAFNNIIKRQLYVPS